MFCRPCFRPALSGCLALAKMTAVTGSKLRLTDGDAAAMATGLLDVNIHGKAVKDRQICLELLIALYQVTPPCTPCVVHRQHCKHHACLTLSQVSIGVQWGVYRSLWQSHIGGHCVAAGICCCCDFAGMRACAHSSR